MSKSRWLSYAKSKRLTRAIGLDLKASRGKFAFAVPDTTAQKKLRPGACGSKSALTKACRRAKLRNSGLEVARRNRRLTQHSRDTPQFYLTAPSPCPYLPGQEERKVFTHLVGERAPELNNLLTHGGFRRSQSIAYRPACERCRACVSVRVIADEFRPTRNMRRVLERNPAT
jgi:hypothetical protein